MRESDLYIPVREWLTARGYTIYVESFDADVIAVKDGKLTAVELKLCLSSELYNQCRRRALWADFVVAAVASEPRQMSGFKSSGFGVLQVRDGKVRQRVMPRPQPWMWHKMRAYRVKKLAESSPALPHHVGGLPSCRTAKEQRAEREAAAYERKMLADEAGQP